MRYSPFTKLSSGIVVNMMQIVQLSPKGHLQLTSNSVVELSPADYDSLVEALELEAPAPPPSAAETAAPPPPPA